MERLARLVAQQVHGVRHAAGDEHCAEVDRSAVEGAVRKDPPPDAPASLKDGHAVAEVLKLRRGR
jgi:hypothetical protein